jgi:integrase
MPKKAKELAALAVQRLTKPGLHAVGGVAGLHLQVALSGARSWVLRVVIGGKRRDMGLGGFPDVSLAGAREKAREARTKIEQGIDPVAERASARSALMASRGAEITFAEAAEKFIDAKAAEWKNTKHLQQWGNTLETYVNPHIGALQVRDIGLAHVVKVLERIWTTKTETATRVRGRIESILDWATVRGYRHGENPARWRGHLDKILAKPEKVAKVKHRPALPYSKVGAFMSDLQQISGISAKALQFAILGAARSGEVRGATRQEFDLEARVWTIPADRMKAGKEHWVPLSDAAAKLIEEQLKVVSGNYLFPSNRADKPISDMSLTAVIRRMDATATEGGGWRDRNGDIITAHGFRSTFRDWAGETTHFPREVIEHALAHQLRDKAEAAYARGTLFEKRRQLMADWASFCASPLSQGPSIARNRTRTDKSQPTQGRKHG